MGTRTDYFKQNCKIGWTQTWLQSFDYWPRHRGIRVEKTHEGWAWIYSKLGSRVRYFFSLFICNKLFQTKLQNWMNTNVIAIVWLLALTLRKQSRKNSWRLNLNIFKVGLMSKIFCFLFLFVSFNCGCM